MLPGMGRACLRGTSNIARPCRSSLLGKKLDVSAEAGIKMEGQWSAAMVAQPGTTCPAVGSRRKTSWTINGTAFAVSRTTCRQSEVGQHQEGNSNRCRYRRRRGRVNRWVQPSRLRMRRFARTMLSVAMQLWPQVPSSPQARSTPSVASILLRSIPVRESPPVQASSPGRYTRELLSRRQGVESFPTRNTTMSVKRLAHLRRTTRGSTPRPNSRIFSIRV